MPQDFKFSIYAHKLSDGDRRSAASEVQHEAFSPRPTEGRLRIPMTLVVPSLQVMTANDRPATSENINPLRRESEARLLAAQELL